MISPNNQVRLGDKIIGTGQPLFLMADMGLTHDGDLGKAKEITSAAAEMGADAIKIQVVDYDRLMADRTAKYKYQTADGPREETLYEIFRKIWLEPGEIIALADHARSLGLELVATADYEDAVDVLEEAQVNCHKIDTWSVTHKRLIQKMGATGKPMFLDMGYSTQHGLEELIDWYQMSGGTSVIVLHDFRSDDPTDMNFRNIPFLQSSLGHPVGFTPQGRDTKFDFMAVGIGADLIEKRITLDRNTLSNGHFKALNLEEWREWAKDVRLLDASLGAGSPRPGKGDLENAQRFLKSLYVSRDIETGERLREEHLISRRPGNGISSARIDELIGKPVRRNIPAGTMLSESDI